MCELLICIEYLYLTQKKNYELSTSLTQYLFGYISQYLTLEIIRNCANIIELKIIYNMNVLYMCT